MLEVINLENNVCSILLQKNILCLQKNIFSIKFHFTLECSNITRKKTKQNKTPPPSPDWHCSKANMRKDAYDWIAYFSAQQSISDTLILTRIEISSAWWSAKKSYVTCYAFSLFVSPGKRALYSFMHRNLF